MQSVSAQFATAVLSADELKEMYREFAVQPIIVRRYTGVGTNRPRFDVDVMGRSAAYGSDELSGAILQTDLRVIILAEDLIAQQFALPIIASDKVLVAERSQELSIMAVLPRKAPDGTLIAYELQCRG